MRSNVGDQGAVELPKVNEASVECSDCRLRGKM